MSRSRYKKREAKSSTTTGNIYVDRATQWLRNSFASTLFSSTQSTAIYAVAEYLANQAGTTNYPKLLTNKEDK